MRERLIALGLLLVVLAGAGGRAVQPALDRNDFLAAMNRLHDFYKALGG